MTDDRGQDRGQKTEDREQRTDSRGQRSKKFVICERPDKCNNELGSPPKKEGPKSMIDFEGFVYTKIQERHNILLSIYIKNFNSLLDMMNIECPFIIFEIYLTILDKFCYQSWLLFSTKFNKSSQLTNLSEFFKWIVSPLLPGVYLFSSPLREIATQLFSPPKTRNFRLSRIHLTIQEVI